MDGDTIWTWLRRLKRIAFRMLVTTFMAVVVLVTGYWALDEWHDRELEKRVSVTRIWPSRAMLVGRLPVEVKTQTQCRESKLNYVVTIAQPIPPPPDWKPPPGWEPVDPATGKAYGRLESRGGIAALREDLKGATQKLIERIQTDVERLGLKFRDKDGFVVVSVELMLSSASTLQGTDGFIEGYELNGSTSCDRPAYARADTLEIAWWNRHVPGFDPFVKGPAIPGKR